VRDEKGEEMHKSKGNAIWFDDAAEQFGADPMRWLYARQDPVQNLSFGPTILREIRGGFLNQLWNTHAFFVNYARVEGYEPGTPVPFADRPDFDRWILTELQETVDVCRASVEGYTHQEAARRIEAFAESLSNWYLRHNRKRFRRDAKDAQSAFETLETCLRTVARLIAPMLPFFAEKLYQNVELGGRPDSPASVHLCAYPVATDERDTALTAEMRALVRITTMALSAREGAKLKLRQPLESLTLAPASEVERAAVTRFAEMLGDELNVKQVIIAPPGAQSPLTWQVKPDFRALGPKLGDKMGAATRAINGDLVRIAAELRKGVSAVTIATDAGEIELARGDFLLTPIQPAGQAVAEDKGTWCAISTVITHALEIEGVMRDLLRRLQQMRKDNGLEISDRIDLRWTAEDAAVVEVFEVWGASLRDDLSIVTLTRDDTLASAAVDIGGRGVKAEMTKV
jgi:isoleucyl-tRNA synthetase